jgi:hypothetical protein
MLQFKRLGQVVIRPGPGSSNRGLGIVQPGGMITGTFGRFLRSFAND